MCFGGKGTIMINYSDFHLHTEFSFDSKEKIDNVCESAIKMGLSSISVTNHYDHDGIDDGIYSEYFFEKDREDILKAKERWKDRITVYYGLEIGQPHTMSDKKINKIESMGYEFIIGSLHNLRNSFDFYYLNYSETTPLFDRGIYKKYVNELKEIASCGFINTVGHITYPERYMNNAGKKFSYSEFEDDFATLFQIISKNNLALEINTSGLRQGLFTTIPKIDILTLYKANGGKKVTVGSDAHYANHVGLGIIETVDKIKSMGFDSINEI